jgi:predicted Fe-Mo cluster-binding NifX family protein
MSLCQEYVGFMIIALSVSNGRIAPLFDVAQLFEIVEIGDDIKFSKEKSAFENIDIDKKADELVRLGVNTLICGAISYNSEQTLNSYGINVVPFICGEVTDVLNAWKRNKKDFAEFLMPGCRRRRRKGGQHCGVFYKENEMFGNGKERSNSSDTKKSGKGRQGGAFAAGPGGICICPKCGSEKTHQQGVPCKKTNCPECGHLMIRKDR